MDATTYEGGLAMSSRWIYSLISLAVVWPAVQPVEAVPSVTASKADVLIVDNDGDGVADPDDTIRYSVVVTNSGTTNGTNVSFVDTIDANTTLVAGSVRTTPVARHDSYQALGNVSMTVPAGSGVLANDNDPDGGGVSVSSSDSSSSFGGAVSVAADGSFAYDPPTGFEGTDSFSYIIIDDEGQTDPANVFIVVSDMVWFVDNSAGVSSDLGTFNQPFTSIASLNNAQGAGATDVNIGDLIFIYLGTGTYGDGVVLQDSQVLLGQGVDLLQQLAALFIVPPASSDLTTSPPSGSANRPTLTTATGDAITVASGNTLRGLNIGNTGGTGISGTSVGSFAVDNFAISGTGGGVDLANGTLAVLLDGLSAVSGTDEGIRLINVAGIFGIEGSGPITTTNAITTTNVAAVDIDGLLTVSINLQSVSVNGGTDGIKIKDTSGSFSVSGLGTTDGSGGTLQNLDDHGIELSNAQNVSISNMNLTNAALTQEVAPNTPTCTNASNGNNLGCNAPVHIVDSTNISLTNLTINGSVQHGVNGNNVNGLTISNTDVSNIGNENKENGMHFINLLGTVGFSNVSVIGSNTRNVLIENNTGTANVTVSNSTFNTAGSEVGLDFLGLGTANITFSVTNSSFTDNNAPQLKALAEDSSVINATISGNDFDGNPAVTGNSGVDLAAVDGGTLDFDVSGTLANPQTFQPFRSHAINIFASGGGTASGRVNGNIINGSALGAGIRVVSQVTDFNGFDPSITIEIDENTISGVQGGGLGGIHIEARDGSSNRTGVGTIDATVTDNDVTTNGADAAIQVYLSDLNLASTPQNRVCINATGNATEANGGTFGETDFFFGNDAISGSNSGVAQMQGFINSVSNTWFNVNSNTTTTSPTPLALGLGPIGGGTCGTVNLTGLTGEGEQVAALPTDTEGAILDSEETAVSLPAPHLSKGFLAGSSEVWSLAVEEGAGPPEPQSGETAVLSLGDLNPGQVVVISFDVTVDATTPPNVTQVCNQGLFAGGNFADLLTDDPAVGGTADPTCTSVAQADLQIAKSDSADPVFTGDSFIYTLTVSNGGPSGAQDVVATDTLPGGVTYVSDDCGASPATQVLTWNIGTLANGSSAVCNVTVTAPGSPGTVTNSAGVSATTHDPDASDNSVSEETSVLNPPDLSIAKDDGGVEIGAGGTITYTLTFANTGGLAASVSITDTVPVNTTFNAEASGGGWSCSNGAPAGTICTRTIGNVAGSSSGSVTFAVTVDDPVAAGVDLVTNTASIGDDGANGPDRNPNDNSDSDTTPVVAAPDLRIVKEDAGVVVGPSGIISYTLTFENVGSQVATGVVITDVVPTDTTFDAGATTTTWSCGHGSSAGTSCTYVVGELVPGSGPVEVDFAVAVVASPGGEETTNTASIADDGTNGADENPGDNESPVTTVLNEPPEVTILLDTPTIQYSDIVSGTIRATDSGSGNLTVATSWSKTGCEPEVETTLGLPDGLEIVPADPADTDACEPASGGGMECAWRLQGQMLESEGRITIEVTVGDGSLETTESLTIVVEPEDVLMEFDPENPIGVGVIEPGGASEPFTLTVLIRELDLTGPQAEAGDIGNAVASMVLVPVGPGSNVDPQGCSETLTREGSDPSYNDFLTLACAFDGVSVNTYNVMVVVDPNEGACAYYLGFGEDVLTVFDPSLGFTTGGGWFYWPGTDDPGSDYPGDRTHVGFHVEIQKKGGKKGQNETVKGGLLAIRHLPDGSIARLKSNSMDGLAVGEDRDIFSNNYGWATFSGKATFQAIGWPEPIGNHEFVAYVEDNGEPGAGADRFWVEVRKDGVVNDDLSLPEPATINAETLEGGNFVVPHSPGGGGGGGGGGRVQNLELVGRGSRLLPGATTDVWALGNYAYVGTFNVPCSDGTGQDGSGVRIWDVTDPTAPVEIDPIPSPAGSRANDVKVARMTSGDILVHSNERCATGGPGGFEVWNVDDPNDPVHLAHVGPIDDLVFGVITDVGVHNLWLFTQGTRDYVAVVAESIFDNHRIYDITDPTNPVYVSGWGAEEVFDPGVGDSGDTARELDALDRLDDGFGNSRNRFLHDVTVSADGNSAYLSNWDAGFILLDISVPANPQVVSVALDPVNGSPDGEVNSHAGWPSEDGSIVVETEEDFSIYSTILTIDTGPSAGDYPAAEGRFTEPLLGSPMSGPTVYVGFACLSDTVPPADPGQIALIQRGNCDFDEKASQVITAEYSGMVVFNHSAGGDALVNIQGVFVGRSTGLAIAGVADESGLSVGAPGETITAATVADAWGGVRIWDYSDPSKPVLASTFFTECSADPLGPTCEADRAYSVHNVVVETDTEGQTRAFLSWYADGVRVLNVTDPYNPHEEFRFVESGSAFEAQNGGPQDVWGIYKETGSDLIFASDRNGGLYILQLPKGKGNK
jgi:uncharacterized repeat protein (TIGR01451 family)